MAVDAAFQKALPLIEYAKGMEGETMERAFIETFTAESDLMAVWPMRAAPNGKFKYAMTAALPDVKRRGINEPGNVSHGRTTMMEEGVFFMDEYVKVDRILIDEIGSQERARQERLKAIAMSQDFSRTLIKGDNTADPRDPSGFQARCKTANVNLFHNSGSSGGGPLSLLNLDIVMNAVNRPTHLLMDYSYKPYWQSAARNPNLTNSVIMMNQTDPFGRNVMTYNGVPILWGYEPDDTAPLMPFTEVASGGGSAVTGSIYVLSLGDDHLFGIEGTPLTVRDEGQLQGTPVYSTHIKWDWGLAAPHPRAMARLDSITKAAIVA